MISNLSRHFSQMELTSFFLLVLFYTASLSHGNFTDEHSETVLEVGARETKCVAFTLTDFQWPVLLRVTPCGGLVGMRLSKVNARSKGIMSIVYEALSYRAMEFYESLGRGNYQVCVTSYEDSMLQNVRLYFSASGLRHAFYPALPMRSQISVRTVQPHSLSLRWHPSPSVTLYQHDPIHYCVVLSPHEPYNSLCHLESVVSQDFLQQYTGRSSKVPAALEGTKDLEHAVQQMAEKTDRKAKRQGLQISCSKNKVSYKFYGLRADSEYHVNVFALNERTLAASAYDSALVKTPMALGSSPSDFQKILRDARMVSSFLNPRRKDFRDFDFIISSAADVALVLQPCSGLLSIEVTDKHDVSRVYLRRSSVRRLSNFRLTVEKAKTLLIHVSNQDDGAAKHFRIWASTDPRLAPFPRLPSDTSIKIVDRNCSAARLQWLATVDGGTYCLYKRMESDDYFKSLIVEHNNYCLGPSDDSELIICKQHSPDVYGLMDHTVDELQVDTTYRIDLFVYRADVAEKISYRTMWVKTRKQC